MKLRLTAALFVLALAGSASARPDGDVIFSLETPTDTIGLWNSVTNMTSTITTFADPNVRLGGLLLAPDGNLYASDGPSPVLQDSTGRIIRIQNPLSGAPIISNLTFGNTISNPIGLAWHPSTGGIIAANNPGGTDFPNNRVDGFIHVSTPAGVQTTIFAETGFPPVPRPGFAASAYLTEDPQGTGDYLVTSIEGGAGPAGQGEGSQIYRMRVNPDLSTTLTLFADLSDPAVTGLPGSLTFVAGITSRPGSNELYVTDRFTNSIYRVLMNGDGSFNSISAVTSTGVPSAEVIVYDPFNNKLVFDTTDGIKRMNLDGTGLETIVPGVHARGLAIVPAPGSAIGLGLLGALAARRRRR
ncbi:MAG: PEP-CTERM sorting domain-containing protein [Phycisphaerales bacterium]